jgi:6-phosphogluconolactonase (cycloisomerase 2 family)
VALAPNGDYLYAANVTSKNYVATYSIDTSSGALTLSGSPASTFGTFPLFVTVDPAGTFAYTANEDSGDVSVYTVGSTGVLTHVTGSPFAAGSEPRSIAIY